jgi:hypothetical protein
MKATGRIFKRLNLEAPRSATFERSVAVELLEQLERLDPVAVVHFSHFE